MARKWTDADVDELRQLWWDHTPKEVFTLMPRFPASSICTKASKLKLKRSPETAQRMLDNQRQILVRRNTTVLGRERNYARAKEAAAEYRTRTEFYQKDLSMYLFVRDNGLWDVLCSHMAIGNFNYSESFLVECVKLLFPNTQLDRNTRQVIKPYELDIYLPELKLAFEYDGSHWHSDESVLERDATKDRMCTEIGIKLYRIKEHRSTRFAPEDAIIKSLSKLGLPVDRIDRDACIESAMSSGITDSYIREKVSGYTKLLEFRQKEYGLYEWLVKRKLAEKYLSGLHRHVADNSPLSIDTALANCGSTSEFREKHLGMYVAMKKDPDKYKDQLRKYAELLPHGYAQDANGKRMGRIVTYNGKTQPIDDWALEIGIPAQLIGKRLTNGWSVDRALTEPRRIRKS